MRTSREKDDAMENLTQEGICLRAVDYGENDKIITLYLAEYGKIGVSAKGCKSAKSKLKYAVSPLCFGKYNLVRKKSFVLAGCDCIDSFFSITADPIRYYCACVILEIVDKMSMEEDYNHKLFVTMLNALNDLCYKSEFPKVCLFEYLSQLTAALGYQVKAITFKDYYNYFLHTHATKINSLKFLFTTDEL